MNTLLKLKDRKLYILPTVCDTIITKSIADEGERTPIIYLILTYIRVYAACLLTYLQTQDIH